jgi:periplasmic copper chaperone A
MGRYCRPESPRRWRWGVVVSDCLIACLIASIGCHRAPRGAIGVGPKLEVKQAWGRCTRGAAKTGSAYFTVVNEGDEPDRLTAASSPVAKTVELHETRMDGDVMRMRPVSGMEVPAGGSLELKRGGRHVMLIGVADDQPSGPTFPLTLTFEKSGRRTVDVELREP